MKLITLEDLYQAALDRRSVTCGTIHLKPTPAAWVIRYQGSLLRHLFRDGIYLHKPKSPTIHFNCCYDRTSCGRHTDRKTADKSKVTCIACRRTPAYTSKP